MSNQKLVVEGSDILSSQMMNFWRQVGDGSITHTVLDRFLAGLDPFDGSIYFQALRGVNVTHAVSAEQQKLFWEMVIEKKITSRHLQDFMERKNPFRQALRKHDGLRRQVETMLLGDDGDIVEAELRNFVAKRPCWTKDDKGKVQQDVGTLSATIDLDANSSLPFNGATIEEHKKGGQVTIEKRAGSLYIDGHKVVLHLSERQVNGKTIQGHELRRELDGKQVLNAGVLDFLMANQSFVPDEMKKDAKGNTVYTFFWGTIYRDSIGDLCVRYCCWDGGGLEQSYRWLGNRWDFEYPAGCLAS